MDLKEKYQEKAEELAEEEHGNGFYALPEKLQSQLYDRARILVHDDLMAETMIGLLCLLAASNG